MYSPLYPVPQSPPDKIRSARPGPALAASTGSVTTQCSSVNVKLVITMSLSVPELTHPIRQGQNRFKKALIILEVSDKLRHSQQPPAIMLIIKITKFSQGMESVKLVVYVIVICDAAPEKG